MTNEHHQSGRRPDKAALERLHPEHRDRQHLKDSPDPERRSQPNQSQLREHTHNDHNLIDEIHQLDGDQ